VTTTTETRPPEQRPSSEPTGAGLGVWIFSSFIALVALAISVAALVVALNHETKSTSGTVATAPVKSPASSDSVALSEYKVNVIPATLSPGNHTFSIANDGRTEHELLVFKTTLDPSAFPIGPDGDINEEAPGMNKVSDGDNIAPGGTQKRTVDLNQPGTYVFVCNLPGHFKAGMYHVVTVK
jgi:uncharacterized cupredoxin-like copper-binding protein